MTARIFDILRYMEQRTARESVALKRMEKIASLPKKHQWFLMARILNMNPVEIANLEGIKNAESITRSIRDVHDQIAAGEKDLILFTPEQRRAAKSRLDKRRRSEKIRSARRRQGKSP